MAGNSFFCIGIQSQLFFLNSYISHFLFEKFNNFKFKGTIHKQCNNKKIGEFGDHFSCAFPVIDRQYRKYRQRVGESFLQTDHGPLCTPNFQNINLFASSESKALKEINFYFQCMRPIIKVFGQNLYVAFSDTIYSASHKWYEVKLSSKNIKNLPAWTILCILSKLLADRA